MLPLTVASSKVFTRKEEALVLMRGFLKPSRTILMVSVVVGMKLNWKAERMRIYLAEVVTVTVGVLVV